MLAYQELAQSVSAEVVQANVGIPLGKPSAWGPKPARPRVGLPGTCSVCVGGGGAGGAVAGGGV